MTLRLRMVNGRLAALLAVIGLAVLLAACSQKDLYGKLTEQQANEMVAALRMAGVAAEKESREGGKSFAVTTNSGDFPRAVEVLNAGGYPKNAYDSMGQVFKKEGFVSSPLEERARYTHALSQEIANTLSSIDGVVQARVHVSVPEQDRLADKQAPATASVFIKHRPDMDMTGQVGQIKALVVNAIEGLPYDNVTVALFKADPLPVMKEPEPSRMAYLNLAVMGVAVLGGVVVLLALWVWLRQRRQRHRGGPGGEATAVVVRTPAAENPSP